MSALHSLPIELFDDLANLLRWAEYDFERFGEAVADMAGLTSEAGPEPVAEPRKPAA
jgi:hypothetical protein